MTRKSNGKSQNSKNFSERSRAAIKTLMSAVGGAIVWAILPLWECLGVRREWLNGRWNRLSPNGQKAVFVCLWLVGVAFGVYSAWFARIHNATAPVIRWGWVRVEARYGFLLLLALVFMPAIILSDRFSQKRREATPSRPQTPSLLRRRLSRLIPPLMLARWLYLRHQDTPALERTQALLAQQPDNAAARELLALIEKQIAKRPADTPDIQQTPRATLSDRLANSKIVANWPRLLVAAMLCLSLYGSYYYTRVGIGQGWQTTVWVGHDKWGNPTQSSALTATVGCLLADALCALYLTYAEDGFANTTAWKRYKAKRSAKRNGQTQNPVESET